MPDTATSGVPKPVAKLIATHLAIHSEIPDFLYWYSDKIVESFGAFSEKRLVPTDSNSHIFNEKGLFSREISPLRTRLDRFTKINVFEISEVIADTCLPLIFELAENRKLGYYVPVSGQAKLNEMARDRILDLNEQCNFKIQSQIITVEPELFSFKAQINDVVRNQNTNFANLFVLAGSRLGNSINPKQYLKNIYDSMSEGDYFSILQAIYSPGNEADIVLDYEEIMIDQSNSGLDDLLDETVFPSKKMYFKWDEEKVNGVRVYSKADKDGEIFGTEIKEGQEITRFRSTRFPEMVLRKMFKEIGFKIIDISFDEHENYALFFLEK